MHNAIAHHLLADAQPIPQQQPTPSQLPSLLCFFLMVSSDMEYPFGQFRSVVMVLSSPPAAPPAPSPCLARQQEELKRWYHLHRVLGTALLQLQEPLPQSRGAVTSLEVSRACEICFS